VAGQAVERRRSFELSIQQRRPDVHTARRTSSVIAAYNPSALNGDEGSFPEPLAVPQTRIRIPLLPLAFYYHGI
jgi:hypothetical protein